MDVQVIDRVGFGASRDSAIDRQRLTERLVEALAPLGFRDRPAKGEETGWQATLTLQIEQEQAPRVADGGVPEGQVYRRVAAAIELRALKSEPKTRLVERHTGQGLVGRNSDPSGSLTPLAEEALKEAAGDLQAEITLVGSSDEVLLQNLTSPELRLRARAIQEAGRRRLNRSVEPLVAILGDDGASPELVFKAIGALIEIRDPRAVGPLIDSARRRAPIYLTQIIFGVAQIGGKEAQAYLFTVATGHPDAEIRAQAQEALDELERRGKGPVGGGMPDGR